MKNLLLIDGNSIMNRAFYGIMSNNKAMTTDDGKYTNALYGFLAILFKNIEEVNPDYIMISFDSKTAANERKKEYDGYKKNRHKMPDELAYQMPEIKEILDAMNIKYVELASFEGDDILGTAAKKFANKDTNAYILSGDRDLFQLAQKNIIIRIPRTKFGKTTTDIYDEKRIEEEYGLTPSQLTELKALMGDSSDEIPGCKGVGPKTATTLIQKYNDIDNLYKELKNNENIDIKEKLKQNLLENEDIVRISKDIGTIKKDATISDNIEDYKIKEWNYNKVYSLFKKYKFNRYIQRFDLENKIGKKESSFVDFENNDENSIKIMPNDLVLEEKNSISEIEIKDELIYFFTTKESDDKNKISKKDITGIAIYDIENNKNIYIKNVNEEDLKKIFEDEKIKKIGIDLCQDYVILKDMGIDYKNIYFDIEVAAYDLNPSNIKHTIKEIAVQYLDIDISIYSNQNEKNNKQQSLFDTIEEDKINEKEISSELFVMKELYKLLEEKLKQDNSIKLYEKIENQLIEVLADMQYTGMICKKEELINFGKVLDANIEKITNKIYELAGEEFNINSTKKLGEILFEKLGLKSSKKTKTGYSTDVDTLEKLYDEHEIIPLILEYRSLMKLSSTYVKGLIPYINEKTKRIHSHFNQTITATGRISSTEPNLQNIPSHDELGRNIKKAFVPKDGYVYIDADYSQIELRVLAHISHDENMLNAFKNDEDIHKEVASKVFNVPLNEVTKEQRSRAKAVNFGIVYGITGFGLAKQIGTSRKEAEQYIESYLEKYNGVKQYMNEVVEKAKKDGYVETLFGRRRYIEELKSNSFNIREFGKRVAMNTPIQGTAADIMKIAMNSVYKRLQEEKLDAKIVLQVHDELLIEANEKDSDRAKEILKDSMENAFKLDIPLKVELSEAKSWYDAK